MTTTTTIHLKPSTLLIHSENGHFVRTPNNGSAPVAAEVVGYEAGSVLVELKGSVYLADFADVIA
jgi:hypothetical protein